MGCTKWSYYARKVHAHKGSPRKHLRQTTPQRTPGKSHEKFKHVQE